MIQQYIKAIDGTLFFILKKDEAKELFKEGKIKIYDLNNAIVLQSGEDLEYCIDKNHVIGVDHIKYFLLKNNLLNEPSKRLL